jgi:hypothetical protein
MATRRLFDGAQIEIGSIPIELPVSGNIMWIKVEGVWKQASAVWIKVAGVWKQAEPKIKISGVWR